MRRVFLVDDHSFIRLLYSEEIEDANGLTVCGTAASFAEALEALPTARPDVALVDIMLGKDAPDGLELMRRLRRSMNSSKARSNDMAPAEGPSPRWLVMSSRDDPATVQQAHEAGADGFLPKREASHGLVAAIRKLFDETVT